MGETRHLASARALAPLVASCAGQAEAGRRLPDELVEAFIDARFFQMHVPLAHGVERDDWRRERPLRRLHGAARGR